MPSKFDEFVGYLAKDAPVSTNDLMRDMRGDYPTTWVISAIDTCILLDVLLPDPVHLAASKALLDRATSEGVPVICKEEAIKWISRLLLPAEVLTDS